MKQSELLKSIAALTPYQKRKLEIYVIDALNLNEEDRDLKPKRCPYCGGQMQIIKKGLKRETACCVTHLVVISSLTIHTQLQCTPKLKEACLKKSY